jgi:hypothetical protein
MRGSLLIEKVVLKMDARICFSLRGTHKWVFPTLLLFTSLIGHAQEDESRFEVGAVGSVQYTLFNFESERFSEESETRNGPQWSGGLRIRLNAGDHWTFTTGAQYAVQTFTHDHNLDFNNNIAAFVPRTTKLSVGSLRIPLMIGYRMDLVLVRILPAVGINLDMHIYDYERTTNEDGKLRESDLYDSEIDTPHPSVVLELSGLFRISDRVDLLITPFTSVAIQSLDVAYTNDPEYGFGLLSGIYLKL